MEHKLFIPRHEASFTLTHNDHKCVYETVAQRLEGDDYYADENWVSPEQRQLAIATDSIWTAHWYPDTPVGFHYAHAATLEVLSAWMQEHFT